MPSWSIHLAIAKKVREEIHLDKDLFFYGSLIPDVDEKTKISRYDAHYYGTLKWKNCPQENKIDINKFLKTYCKELNNSLILGYYAHLLTDNYYNEVVYLKHWIQDKNNNIIGIKLKNDKIISIDIEDKERKKRKYKHLDFELYGKYLFNNSLIIPLDINKIIQNAKYLKPQFLTKNLINYRVNYLNSKFIKFNKLSLKQKIFKHKYKLFMKFELDTIFDECCNYVIKEIKKLGVLNE